ncbi:MAG: cupin domain-containing protein [Candidatus Woesearchaeota archaeon]
MEIFDLKEMEPSDNGKPQKVLYEGDNFTTRIIKLESGGQIPDCEMSASVIFNVISGSVEIKVNGESSELKEGECLITEPATVSMNSSVGAKIMGIQIEKFDK